MSPAQKRHTLGGVSQSSVDHSSVVGESLVEGAVWVIGWIVVVGGVVVGVLRVDVIVVFHGNYLRNCYNAIMTMRRHFVNKEAQYCSKKLYCRASGIFSLAAPNSNSAMILTQCLCTANCCK